MAEQPYRMPDSALTARARAELNDLQNRLGTLYQLEPAPDIVPFVQVHEEGREQVLVKESDGMLELAVLLPNASVLALNDTQGTGDMDAYLGAVEGVSH